MVADPSNYRIGALLTIGRSAIGQAVRARCAELGFSDISAAHEVPMQVLAPEGMRLTDLAARAGMAKQSMAYLVQELERAGYLERVPDPADGRAKIIRRTERAWAYSRLAAGVVSEIEEEWARLLGRYAFDQMKRTLTRLVESLGHSYPGSVAEARARRGTGRPPLASY